MITKPTTLILGAGASAPFGFPTGNELKQRVLSINYSELAFGPIPKIHVKAFKNALSKSGKTSVDAFLEHRTDFILVGKIAIAMSLIACEDEASLFVLTRNSWYEYLFNQLNTNFDDFEKNRLNILTFNYDRSLEHYLFTCLMYAYGKSAKECAAKMKSIPIIHLHGDLGGLPELEREMIRKYGTTTTPLSLNIASTRIKIIHEGIDKEPQFAKAKETIANSDVVCFLGFRYHPLNMERLGFKNLFNSQQTPYYKHSTDFFGSCFGMTQAECKNVISQSGLAIKGFHYPDYHGPVDVLQFLRETGILHGN